MSPLRRVRPTTDQSNPGSARGAHPAAALDVGYAVPQAHPIFRTYRLFVVQRLHCQRSDFIGSRAPTRRPPSPCFAPFESATRAIAALTDVMARLSSGELDAAIPALDRFDEGGRMAHVVEVFKRNAIEVKRLSAEQARMKAQSERDRVELLDFQTVAAATQQLSRSVTRLRARSTTVQQTEELK
jgi:hypothetical protein